MSEPLATVSASAFRRVFGVGMLLGLGGIVLYVAFARPPEALAWRLFLVALGIAVLALAEMMRRATAGRVVLTEEGLFDGAGRTLAPIEEITGIERGMFAMKPSNGFVVRLSRGGARGWAPGLWWRLGRRLGIGGVTSAAQSKVMAEVLTAVLARRKGEI